MSAVEYDPYAYENHEDPYPTYQRLREEAPLYFNAERDFYALSRHADVSAAFRDSGKFSSTDGVSLDPAASGPGAARTASFLAMDPPRHTRMRALVSRAFTPKRVAELEPRVREIAVEHLGPALEQGEFDFITDFAGRLPMDVVCELLGVPASERDELRRLSDLVVHREDGLRDIPQAGIDAVFALITYYVELVAARRAQPADDLTSALLEAEIDGDRLNDDDIVGFLFLMVVAGNETTTKLLGNAWYWAWRNPDGTGEAVRGPGADRAVGGGDAAVRRLHADARPHRRAGRCAARRRDSGGWPRRAADRFRESGSARVRSAGGLRPRPPDAAAAARELRVRAAPLPWCLAGAPRGARRAGGARASDLGLRDRH